MLYCQNQYCIKTLENNIFKSTRDLKYANPSHAQVNIYNLNNKIKLSTGHKFGKFTKIIKFINKI